MLDLTPLTINAWLWIALGAFWLIASFFVYPTKVRESYLQRQRHVLPLYLGFFLIFYDRRWGPIHHALYDNDAIRYTGDIITFIGVTHASWARITLGRYWSGIITLKQNHRLIRTGPYRFTRHPLYTGFVIGVIGSAITAAHLDAFIGAAIATLSLIYKLRREENLLTSEFGEEYLQFKKEVPAAILPGVY